MSSLDSISEIVLGNVKVPSEKTQELIPFLEEIKRRYGVPLAAVHDLGAGILAAIQAVFPSIPDFTTFTFSATCAKVCWRPTTRPFASACATTLDLLTKSTASTELVLPRHTRGNAATCRRQSARMLTGTLISANELSARSQRPDLLAQVAQVAGELRHILRPDKSSGPEFLLNLSNQRIFLAGFLHFFNLAALAWVTAFSKLAQSC